jgi:hypothetical protein
MASDAAAEIRVFKAALLKIWDILKINEKQCRDSRERDHRPQGTS